MWRRLSSLRLICLKVRRAGKPAPRWRFKAEPLSHKHRVSDPPFDTAVYAADFADFCS